MSEKSPTRASVGKATLLDWRPDKITPKSPKETPREIDDYIAYPKSSGDSRNAFVTGAAPISRDGEPMESPVHHEEGAEKEQPLTPWQRRKQHVRRYWYWYVPLAIIALAVVLIIMFVAIIPAIAQRVVDNASLPLHSAMLINPSPNNVEFSLNSSIKLPPGLAATTNPINLSLAGVTDESPYAYVELPKKHLSGTTTISIANQSTKLADPSSFTSFLKTFTYQKSYSLHAYGKTNAYLGKIKAGITLDKTIVSPGLQNLTGFTLSKAQLVLPALPNGTNLLGTAVIPNYSVISFELGNVTLNMMMGGIVVGSAYLENVYLKPGNTSMPLQGTLNLTTVYDNIGPILVSQTAALKQGNLQINSTGNTTIYNGQHLTYYEEVLDNMIVIANVPVATILNGTLGPLVNSSNPLLAKIGQIVQNLEG